MAVCLKQYSIFHYFSVHRRNVNSSELYLMQIVLKNIQELRCGYWNASLKERMFSLSPNESLLNCSEQTLCCTACLSGEGGGPDWCSSLVLQYFSCSLRMLQSTADVWSCALPVLPGRTAQPLLRALGAQQWVPAWCPTSPGGSSPQQLLLQRLRGYQGLVAHTNTGRGPMVLSLFLCLCVSVELVTSGFSQKKHSVILEVMIWSLMSLLMCNHPAGWREATCKWAMFIQKFSLLTKVFKGGNGARGVPKTWNSGISNSEQLYVHWGFSLHLSSI